MTPTLPATRIPALAAVRSVLMLLGIVLHIVVVLPFFVPNLSMADAFWLGVVYRIIHVFRVPTFFIVSGFLASALLARSSIHDFLVSRFKRLTSVALTAQIMIAAIFATVGCSVCAISGSPDWLHAGWLHLWFLYYLVLISHAAILVVWGFRHLPQNMQQKINRMLSKISASALWVFAFAVLASIVPNTTDSSHLLVVDSGVVPNLWLFMFFSLTFWAGWLLHRNQTLFTLRDQLFKYLFCVVLALVILLISPKTPNFALANHFAENLLVWFASFAVLAAFIKFSKKPVGVWNYLNDAAYWVYLWHAVAVLAGFAMLAPLFIATSLSIWLLAAAVYCFALAITVLSYHWLVRPTIIGRWLSGRRRRPRAQLG